MRGLSSRRFRVVWFVVVSVAAAMVAGSVAVADEGDAVWTRQFGTSERDHAYGVVTYATSVYVVGGTEAAMPGQTHAGEEDAFVLKYDRDGNEQWTRQFGTSSNDYAGGVAADTSGVYVTGSAGELPGQTTDGGWDVFLRKYDHDGNEIWTRQVDSSVGSTGFAVAVDATGVYVVGYATGALPGQTHAGIWDAFVIKYDRNGNEQWTHQFGTAARDDCVGVAIDATGVYVSGYTEWVLPGQTSLGNADVYVRKYDHDGNEIWTHQFGSSSGDYASGLAVDSHGVYVTGATDGALPGQTQAGERDAFVRMYDLNGNEQWTRQFGTDESDRASGLALGATGVYVGGITDGILPGQSSAGLQDSFVRKYGRDGSEQWTRQFGSPFADGGQDVAVDVTGIYVTGYVNGEMPGGTSNGYFDAFVRKYDPDFGWCKGAATTIQGSSASDTLVGTSGDDVIHGMDGDDTIDGRGGDDVICGGNGNDTIRGKAGGDHLYGGSGNDKLNGGNGNDVLSGGLGKDTVVYFGASAGVTVDLAAGTGGGANQGADTIIGVEHVMGSLFGDVLRGSAAGNRLKGLPGADELVGLGGADTLIGAGDNDLMYGGGGNDVLQGKAGSDRLVGGPGNDTLEGNIGNDKLYGGDGIDDLNGGNGTDTCYNGETYVSCELPL